MSAVPLLVICLLPLACSVLLCAALVGFAPRLGLVDAPAARKLHTRAVPLGGGLAIALPLLLLAWPLAALQPGLFGDWLYPPPADPRWLLALVLVVLGLVDDVRPLPWQLRIGVHFAVAVAAVFGCLPPLGPAARLLAVLWIAAMINAFNMLDNMDALSGGVAWVAAAVLAVIHLQAKSPAEAAPCLTLLATLAGFLWFNRPPARLFMGDAGSTFLGFFVALSGLQAAARTDAPGWSWLLPPCVCGAACYDMVSVVALRLWQGRSPFHADKQHLSHRLVQRGLSKPLAVGVILLMALASGLSGLLLDAVHSWPAALLTAAQPGVWWIVWGVFELSAKCKVQNEKHEAWMRSLPD